MKLNYSRKKKNKRKPEEKFLNFQYYQKPDFKDFSFTMPTQNYDGVEFASALATQLNEAFATFSPKPVLSVTYDILQNILVVSLSDSRSASAKTQTPIYLQILTDEVLQNPPPGTNITRRSGPRTISTILRITIHTVISEANPRRRFFRVAPN